MHASLISVDVADTLFRDRSRFSADGIALPMRVSKTTWPRAYATERPGSGLKNRFGRRHCVRNNPVTRDGRVRVGA